VDSKPTVSIIGGSGALGSGLACRLAKAGYDTIIGSRAEAKAAEAAAALAADIPGSAIKGMTNRAAAESGDLSILTVPFAQHDDVIDDIRAAFPGKILIDSTVPLVPPRVARVTLPPGGSVALATQNSLGQDVRVVSAFHNLAASHLRSDHVADRCDVLVFGNNKEARALVVLMAQDGFCRLARRRYRQCCRGRGSHLGADFPQQEL
jgi:8-hydroxy-5-deazaflavin:NADPH oxidoreductase